MEVRGAPLIGVTAAFGLALALRKDASSKNIDKTINALLATRPTAVNLRWALSYIFKRIKKKKRIQDRAKLSFELAKQIRQADIINCFKIGLNGYKIIEKIYKKKKKKQLIFSLIVTPDG